MSRIQYNHIRVVNLIFTSAGVKLGYPIGNECQVLYLRGLGVGGG